ncbi:MAG: carbohydrate porin [Candidatus Omnitrophica bacterium]|nr:carbohydrate porin [Candidatus Omnitrophota bacterium]MDD5440934.1 carbohydrate porin [Candidatus Omnitrophota bacterium]
MRVKGTLSLFLVLGFLIFSVEHVFGGTTGEEILELKQRIEGLEAKLAEDREVREKEFIAQNTLNRINEVFDGLSIGGGATFIMQGTNNANGESLSNNSEDSTDASYSIDLEFEKEFKDYGKAFIHLETGDGSGVEDELALFSSVNRDVDDSDSGVSVTEAWYEHYFSKIPLALTFGKIDPTAYLDGNNYANDECSQFLGHVFRNSPVIEFPDDNGAGIHALLEPLDFFDIELTLMDADADWENVGDNIFFAGQVNIKPGFYGKDGNYRFYVWLNNKDHIKWTNSSESEETNYGAGISFDQELTDIMSVFLRYGWQNPEVYVDGSDFSLEQSWSAGVQFSGDKWNRGDDVLALAFGQIIPSDDYKNCAAVKGNTENHFEAYYNFRVNEHLSLTPDIQVIWDPYGGDAVNGDKTVFVGGLRAQIDF